MKFSARQDIDTPSAYVFDALSDFDAWERMALRRGAEVTRTDTLPAKEAGMSWSVKYTFRGRRRAADVKLVHIQPNTKLEFAAKSPAIEAAIAIEIIEMSARRSRVHVTLNVTPQTLAAKLFIQSVRLARTRADRRFAQRIASITSEIEDRFRSEQVPR
jgi:hypothetical protein